MLDSMTHEQFAEWCAKDIIEPIGASGTNDILSRIGVLIAMYMGNKEADETLFQHWKKLEQPAAKEDTLIAALEMVGARRT